MNREEMVAALEEEISRLERVRDLLQGSNSKSLRGANVRTKAETKPARKKRVLSPEARKRIAEAQKRRWAAQKKGA